MRLAGVLDEFRLTFKLKMTVSEEKKAEEKLHFHAGGMLTLLSRP
jgi:hypothetical protein